MQETDTRVTFDRGSQSQEDRISIRRKDPVQGGSLSRDQFDQCYRDARPTLWCIAAAVLGRRDRAEDVLQDAVVTALTKLDQFDPGTSFSAWMGQIVRFTALNARRDEINRPVVQGVDPNLAGSRDPTSHEHAVDAFGRVVADQKSFDDEVLAALAQLGETPRACLLLRTVRGLSYKEVARVLDLPEGTCMSHVHRARTLLRQTLSPGLHEGTP